MATRAPARRKPAARTRNGVSPSTTRRPAAVSLANGTATHARPTTVRAYAAHSAAAPLSPFSFERRAPGPRDVEIDILFCGVCHSDLHAARGEWPGIMYPCVPGHEIIGRVARVGPAVKSFKPGDTAAVGCIADSCRACRNCKAGLQQYCEKGAAFLYISPDPQNPGRPVYGGYASKIVVDDRFVLKVSKKLDPAAAAPLLCAGITTYSPLRHWKAGKGKKVGIVGLGGLGHMGVKFSHAFGAHTVLFTTSPNKTDDALELGADEVVISKDPAQMKKHVGSFDFILNTVAAPHNLDAYTELLRTSGSMCLVGAPASPHPSPSVWNLIMGRRSIAGSAIGGIPETQEMLDFCAAKGIVSDIEKIDIQEIETAYERMVKSDVKYRFVIDMASLTNG